MDLLIKVLVTVFLFEKGLADYWSDRQAILDKEASTLLGSSINLTEKEQQVNDILMNLKLKEFDEGFADPSKFLPSLHFFQSKERIEQSEVFKFIQLMPKGASLHSHSTAMVSFDFLFNLTYYEDLYGCDDNGTFRLHFGYDLSEFDCDWKLLSQWRAEDEHFDEFLKSQMTIVVDEPATYTDINAVWNKFQGIFGFTSSLFDYRPFLHDYLYQVFQEFYDDNVMYMEIRGSFEETYDANGTVYNATDTIQFYLDVLEEFVQGHPGFIGFRIIYARNRKITVEKMDKIIAQYTELQNLYPELIAGFDLVGQEDLGEPLSVFADQLLAIANRTKFFFHAGETNWYGSPTDLNLIDAVLLNTSRIGHGFAISKHPEVLRIVKEKGIAIEVNPISNQVLKLVDDIRNHVGTTLIAEGYPVVITCDDPSFWGAKGLSYDWYLAFMGMTPRNGDLRVLKQLALNSLIYSAVDDRNKPYYLAIFEGKWDEFLDKILQKY